MTGPLKGRKKSFEKCCQLVLMFYHPLRKIRPETQSYLLDVVIDFKKGKTESNSIDCSLLAELMEQNNRGK